MYIYICISYIYLYININAYIYIYNAILCSTSTIRHSIMCTRNRTLGGSVVYLRCGAPVSRPKRQARTSIQEPHMCNSAPALISLCITILSSLTSSNGACYLVQLAGVTLKDVDCGHTPQGCACNQRLGSHRNEVLTTSVVDIACGWEGGGGL